MTCPCHAGAAGHAGAPPPPPAQHLGLGEIVGWWTWEPLVLVALVLCAIIYTRGLRRLWRSAGPGRGIRRREAAAYGAGLLTIAVALLSPLDRLSDILFSAHMSQHELLMLVAPPLIVIGRPVVPLLWAMPDGLRERALRLARRSGFVAAWRALTAPLVALFVHGAVLWLWHVPALFQAALASEAVHAVQHLSFFLTALLFFWGLLHGRYGRAGYGASVIYVFATALHSGLLGALLSVAGRPWYPAYAPRAARFGVDVLVDQQLAGLIMWIPAGVVLMVVGLALFSAWIGESERRAARARWLQGLGVLLLLLGGCARDDGRAAARTGGDPARGQEALRRYGCVACHSIPGVPGAASLVGPPLDHLASRVYLAGSKPNTPENLLEWVRHPQEVRPGTAMPEMGVTEQDGRDIAAYLYTLR